jgi:hypothetical protein
MDPAGARAAGLRPELIPGVEVVIVLPTLGHTAVLELEDQTHVNVQVLAVSLRAVALKADHPLVICKQVLQFNPESPSRLLSQTVEKAKVASRP